MVRESRFIKVGQIPNGITVAGINTHFGKYGKVHSVRLEERPECLEAVVAFTDIKAASQAYNEDQLLNDAVPLSIAFCDAAGTAQSEPRCAPAPVVSTKSTSVTSPTATAAEDGSKSGQPSGNGGGDKEG